MSRTAAELAQEAAYLRSRAAEVAREAVEAQKVEYAAAQAARDARKPKAPNLAGGPVVVLFDKVMIGRTYSYAAIGWSYGGNSSRWAITASRDPRTSRPSTVDAHGRYTWNALLEFVGEANWATLRRVTDVQYLITPEDEPAVVEKIGDCGRVTATENVEDWHGQTNAPRSPFTAPRHRPYPGGDRF